MGKSIKSPMSEIEKRGSASDHLANERTLLAWIRTSIGIMAFGFVVVKFTLFIKQISLLIDNEKLRRTSATYSDEVGIVLVVVGALTIIMAFFRYRQTEKRLASGTYYHSSRMLTLLTFSIFLVSILLIVYLLNNI